MIALLALHLVVDAPAECPAAAFEARMAGILAGVTGEARLEVQPQGGAWVAELALGTGVRRLVGADCATVLEAVGLSLEVALLDGSPEGGLDATAPRLDAVAPRLDAAAPRLDAAAPRLDAAAAIANRPAEASGRPAELPERPAAHPRRPPSPPKRPAELSKRPPPISERPAKPSKREPSVPERPPSMPERPAELPDRPPSIPERRPSIPERPAELPGRPAELPGRPAELPGRQPSTPERPPSIPERPPSTSERPASISERPPSISERPAVAPADPPGARAAARPAEAPGQRALRLTAAALLDLGTTPGLTAGAQLGFEYPLAPATLGFEAAWLAPSEAAAGAGRVFADAFAARLIGCRDGALLGLCGTATAAFQRVGGEGFKVNHDAQTPFLSVGLRVRHALAFAPIHLAFEAAAPLSRTRLRVDGAVVWETPPVVLQLGLGGRLDL